MSLETLGYEDPYEEYGGYKPSTEIMFQEIVKQAQQDVQAGVEGAARRSSRRLVQKLKTIKPSSPDSNTVTVTRPKRSAPVQRQDDEVAIRVGARYQAEVVDLHDLQIPSDEQREAEDERSECVWHPDIPEKVSPKDMEDFVSMCRRHMDVGSDLAMRSLYKHEFNIPKALEDMEADFKDHWKKRFLKVEDDALITAYLTYGKNFGKIAKSVRSRQIHECIGRFYDVKKKICYMSKHICPTLMRLKKMYRPSTLKFTPGADGLTEEERDSLYYEHTTYFDINDYLNDKLSPDHPPPPKHILSGYYYVADPSALDVSQPYEKKIPVFTEPHENCFFVSTTQTIRWQKSTLDFDVEQKEKIVEGFLKFGKNFSKITKFANVQSVETVRHFYDVYGDEYRLDFLIAQYNQAQAVHGRNNESDEDSENHVIRRRMTMKMGNKKPTMRTRAATAGANSLALRRTARRRTVREMS
ncbi:hypothetical protein QR680_002750 [Steinernema hermaphroditum]|uniref:SANT domain-containing protein n=1 Tax=Steinernema hermaphroditum TaxID=289476 RepID=A0AA39H3Z2_9BILA|nr:hypothetical protein QR680_002750 [Steinernema hermaphroditum]